ncbi:glycosyltransferase 87 family protein [Stieleria varia]|uniref:DUF2029 domain-containing protein n=1 Tax=Stieleria varia TaxID=2528005 RepID=A0A5C5ZZK3_9BACT|nr:hypothetical protein [Stieleria varia]TWT92729.1 hypothetical protein Pla52n_60940 [Stieleria varia]
MTQPLVEPASVSSSESMDAGRKERLRIGNRWLAAIAACLLILGLVATVARIHKKYQTPGPFDHERQGLCDFHNGVYFPAMALMRGESPYGQPYADKYPVARQIPFFSPVVLALHAPLAMLPIHAAEVIHTMIQIALLLGIAWLATITSGFGRRFDVWLCVAAMMIFSRGGHISIFTGYFTLLLVMATYLAVIWAKDRPVLSGWMLLIVSGKPTFILPLGFLMLARGNIKALLIGAAMSIGAALLLMGWLAHHEGQGDLMAGAKQLLTQVSGTQEVHRGMDDESPVHSWTRLDAFAVISKWRGANPGELAHLLTMFVFLAIPMYVLRRGTVADQDDGIAGVTGTILMTALLTSLYHQSYDSLLLVAPMTGAVAAILPAWKRLSLSWRATLLLLMGCPLMNYLSTRMFLTRFELPEFCVKVLTSLNGVCLLVAMVIACVLAWRQLQRPTSPCTDVSLDSEVS